jgi:hypothetical protein
LSTQINNRKPCRLMVHPVLEAERTFVDLRHIGLGKEGAAIDRVVGEARPHGDHQIGLREQLAGDLAGETARDPDGKAMVIEHAARRQSGGEQRAARLRQLLDGGVRTGRDRAPARDDDRPLHGRELLGQEADGLRVGWCAAALGNAGGRRHII